MTELPALPAGLVLPRRLRSALLLTLILLTAAGAAVEIAEHQLADNWMLGLSPLLNLSYEGNIPTWYSSSLLLACALALWRRGQLERRRPSTDFRQWHSLGWIFLYLSMDEAVVIHELLNPPLRRWLGLGGIFYHAWVLPAAAILVVLAMVFARFLHRLEAGERRAFIVAGSTYVLGALGTELPVNLWYTRYGAENLTYGLINVAQESLEILGASLFLLALVRGLEGVSESRSTATI